MATTVEAVSTMPTQQADSTPFPVTWEQPGDERLLWLSQPMHLPNAVTAATGSYFALVYQGGFNKAAERYAMPIRGRAQRINAFVYQAIYPIGAPPEAVLKMMGRVGKVAPGLVNAIQGKAVGALTKKYLDQMEPVLARLGDFWESDLLPEVRGYLADWEAFDLPGATTPEILAHYEQTLKRAERLGELHFLIGFTYLLAMSLFDELYHDLFGPDDRFGAFRLLQGFDNQSLAADRALWNLSRRVREVPEARALAEGDDRAAALQGLRDSRTGAAFLAEWGQRGPAFDAIGEPSWIEDPTPVFAVLRDYVSQPDRNLATEMATLAAEREQGVAEARARLAGYPAPVRERFETLLKAAQAAVAIHEDHNYWIDQRGQYSVRQVLRELGRRFAAAGVVAQADDVFHLTLEEAQVTAAALPRLDRHALVRDRAAEVARFRDVTPPPALGTPPLMPPPDDPLGRTIGKFFGTPIAASEDAREVRGHAGSPGVVRGTVRLVRTLAEAGRLHPGDILVTGATTAPWTPLFTIAGAIVTDTGGVLSHCAVVAREYRRPAVVGTGDATRRLQDGQQVEVDGDTGVVRML
jgi:phosphohistidine swiveling domain-containing protein